MAVPHPEVIIIKMGFDSFFILKPPTLQGTIAKAKEVLYLDEDATPELSIKMEDGWVTFTESMWPHTGFLTKEGQLLKVRVSLLDEKTELGKRRRAKEALAAEKAVKDVKKTD